uniref:Uncharacterized protein n=1 Tax=Strigamia maritima TaxID=126957 RepID=T1J3F6_STRMM
MQRNSNFLKVVNGDPTISWDVIREDVGEQLFGNKYSTIPILNEAKAFDILCVYKKVIGESTTTCTKCFQSSTYQIIGFLRDLLLVPQCNRKRLLDIAPRDVVSKIAPVYQFSHQEIKDGLLKEVILRVFSVYHQQSRVERILSEEIYLDTSIASLRDLKTVYILSDVYFCRRFYLYTRIGCREIIHNQANERIPLGFRSAKFKLGPAGSLNFKKVCKYHQKWISSGVRVEVTNTPLLPVTSHQSRIVSRTNVVGAFGHRKPNSIFRKLSLKTMS